jgi:hypothetical protein
MRRTRHFLSAAAAALGLAALGPTAQASEVVLEHSAVDKLLAQTLFNSNGRYVLRRGPCAAWLENPTVELRDGRVRIRSHLTAAVGAEVNGSCLGTRVAGWATVSGRPVAAANGTIRLDDLRADDVSDPNLRMLIEAGVNAAFPRAIELDMNKAVRDMLRGNPQFQGTVDALTIAAVTVADDRIAIRFDFRLVAR